MNLGFEISDKKERFFYHSFPRRGREDENVDRKGLAILTSIAKSGFLLTPEKISWSEFLQDGTKSESIDLFQKRVCFTELAEYELAAHSNMFGPFAVEFSIENLRCIGAMPVFYIPLHGDKECALGGIAAAFICRLSEIQRILEKISDIKLLAQKTANKAESIQIALNGIAMGAIPCTIGNAENLLNVLFHKIQPPEQLLNALRALSGFFYPTENMAYTGELAYYRQREWRIVANMVHRGVEITRDAGVDEKMALCAIDPDYFGHRMIFPCGEYRRVDQCKFISEIDNRPLLWWARRIIVPDHLVKESSEVVGQFGHAIPVVPRSDLSNKKDNNIE